MNLIVCVDKNFGMAFNRRRVSQDREVIRKIAELTAGSALYMSPYSAPLFSNVREVNSREDFLLAAGAGDFCLVEIDQVAASDFEEIYLFYWNRNYPADHFFAFDPKNQNFKRIKKEEFEGSSHKKITLEVYQKVL